MSLDQAGRVRGGIERGGEPTLKVDSQEPRVLFLADRLPIGGAERVLQTLCTGLPRLGIETGLSTLRDPGPVGVAIAEAGIPVESGIAPRARSPLALASLVAHLHRVQPDLLYVLDHSNALFLGRLAARLAGIPAQVCAIHRTRRADGSPSLGLIDRSLMPLSDAVIAVSEGQARYLASESGIPSDKLHVIYNGVAVDEQRARLSSEERTRLRSDLGLPTQAPLVAIVAALRPEKNHELLFEALARMDWPGVPELVVVGEGVREEQLREGARDLGLQSRVHWLGVREDVPRILDAVDLLALSSHPVVETFPLCILEAMSAGLPVVSTRVGSLDEMVEHGVSGLLVAPGDATALAAALAFVLENPSRGRAMGEAGRLRALRNFDRRFMVEGTARLIRGLTRR